MMNANGEVATNALVYVDTKTENKYEYLKLEIFQVS